MKYLQPSFTFYVSAPRPRSLFDRYRPTENDRKRDKPHEYVNGGVMCLVCGLDRMAKIHQE